MRVAWAWVGRVRFRIWVGMLVWARVEVADLVCRLGRLLSCGLLNAFCGRHLRYRKVSRQI